VFRGRVTNYGIKDKELQPIFRGKFEGSAQAPESRVPFDKKIEVYYPRKRFFESGEKVKSNFFILFLAQVTVAVFSQGAPSEKV